MSSLVRSSNNADHTYNIVLQFEKLENHVKDVETTARGFMITKDSSFLEQMSGFDEKVNHTIDSLRTLLRNDTALSPRLNVIIRLIQKSINLQRLNIQKITSGDTLGLLESLNEEEYYMNQFRNHVQSVEMDGITKSEKLDREKKSYERLTPNYFSIVLIFSGVITLISFFYIIREIKIRVKYQKELEKRLQELNRSYAELEQFTFVASHDLQEPLRKIRTFSDRLLSKYSPQLDPKARIIIERMDHSAGRLQELILDVTNFSALINKEENTSVVDLNEILTNTLEEFAGPVRQGNINVLADQLPIITGYRKQLQLLFTSLIDNAIKFSNTSPTPTLKIIYSTVKKENGYVMPMVRDYHKISVEDNGIGFENEFAEKIFIIFQRLHTQQSSYTGKGIGLAIAQRVMVNHDGFIIAKGYPGKGAEFSFYFPVVNE